MMLSVTVWASNRPRLTPRARRTAVSRRRLTARASIRLITLAQAMRSTTTATPVTQSRVRDSSPADGPAVTLTGPARPKGRAVSTGGVPGDSSRSAFQLRT